MSQGCQGDSVGENNARQRGPGLGGMILSREDKMSQRSCSGLCANYVRDFGLHLERGKWRFPLALVEMHKPKGGSCESSGER